MPLARRAIPALVLGCLGSLLGALPARSDPAPAAAVSAVREAAALLPGEATAPLAPAAETVIDPAATFRVVLGGAFQDARLQLLDATGAAVASGETREVGATTILTLAPSAALVPAGHYQLRLDGVSGRELHLGTQTFPPARWELRVAGDPPPAPAKASAGKKRHHRG
jgi:hypothetical protein